MSDLCDLDVDGGRFHVDSPIKVVQGDPSDETENSFRAIVGKGGQESLTRCQLVAINVDASLCVVQAWPATGRTHQIRVHLASVGMPIIGDKLYWPGPPGHHKCARHYLHAQRIDFTYDGDAVTGVAPLPTDMASLVAERFPGVSL